MNEPTRIAAIDIGSDTVHLLVGSVDGTGDDSVVIRVEQRGEPAQLGDRDSWCWHSRFLGD